MQGELIRHLHQALAGLPGASSIWKQAVRKAQKGVRGLEWGWGWGGGGRGGGQGRRGAGVPQNRLLGHALFLMARLPGDRFGSSGVPDVSDHTLEHRLLRSVLPYPRPWVIPSHTDPGRGHGLGASRTQARL